METMLNMVCWDPDLSKIVEDTEAAVEALNPVGLEEDIVAKIRSAAEEVRVKDEVRAERAADFERRFSQAATPTAKTEIYMDFVREVPTVNTFNRKRRR